MMALQDNQNFLEKRGLPEFLGVFYFDPISILREKTTIVRRYRDVDCTHFCKSDAALLDRTVLPISETSFRIFWFKGSESFVAAFNLSLAILVSLADSL